MLEFLPYNRTDIEAVIIVKKEKILLTVGKEGKTEAFIQPRSCEAFIMEGPLKGKWGWTPQGWILLGGIEKTPEA
jgi:hypothetical protein